MSENKQIMEKIELWWTGCVISQPREKELKETRETLRIDETDPMLAGALPFLSLFLCPSLSLSPFLSHLLIFFLSNPKKSFVESSDKEHAVRNIRYKFLDKYYWWFQNKHICGSIRAAFYLLISILSGKTHQAVGRHPDFRGVELALKRCPFSPSISYSPHTHPLEALDSHYQKLILHPLALW